MRSFLPDQGQWSEKARTGKPRRQKFGRRAMSVRGHLQEEHRSLGIRNGYMSGTRGKEGETET